MDALNIHRVLAKNKENMLNQRLAISLLSCYPEAFWDTPQPSLPPFAIVSHLTFSLPVCKLPLNLNLSQVSPHCLNSILQLGFPLESFFNQICPPNLEDLPLFLGKAYFVQGPAWKQAASFSWTACSALEKWEVRTWLLVFTPEQRGFQGPPKRSPNHPLHSDQRSPFYQFFKLGF